MQPGPHATVHEPIRAPAPGEMARSDAGHPQGAYHWHHPTGSLLIRGDLQVPISKFPELEKGIRRIFGSCSQLCWKLLNSFGY